MDLPPDKLKIVKMLPDEKKIQFLKSLVSFLGIFIFIFISNIPRQNLKIYFYSDFSTKNNRPIITYKLFVPTLTLFVTKKHP